MEGTQNVVDACDEHAVSRLIYTSSASVVFDGRDLLGVTEDAPYAEKPLDYYTTTKIAGEKLVLAANNNRRVGGLLTCALRPSGIFGPGDTLFVPTLAKQGAAGKSKYIIGDGRNLMDFTYVGNVADCHLLADEALRTGGVDWPDSCPADGRPFFVTNGQPVPFWSFLGDVLGGLGYPRPRVKLPLLLLLFLAAVFEYVVRPLLVALLRRDVTSDFTLNRMRIASSNRTFSIAAARRDLGYVPTVTLEEGIAHTLAAYQHLRAGHSSTATAAAASADKGAKATSAASGGVHVQAAAAAGGGSRSGSGSRPSSRPQSPARRSARSRAA